MELVTLYAGKHSSKLQHIVLYSGLHEKKGYHTILNSYVASTTREAFVL
jgi:hypothetical protein